MGNGDLKSGSDWWRIISNIMGMGSMFFVSLGISYLLPVLQAVIAQRTLAAYIYQLGNTPEDIIRNDWNGKDFSALQQKFGTLETMILKLSELNDRRCMLLGLIEKDLWHWQDINRAADLPADKSYKD